MDERIAGVAAGDRGLVTLAAAQCAGITRSCVRWAVSRGQLVVLARGVWCPTALWERLDARGRHVLLVRAAQRRRRDAVACAESAAVVWGLPLPGDPPPEPRLLAARDPGRRGGDGVKGGARGRRAYLEPEETTVVAGVRVTTPGRTVVDVARHLPFPWALAAGDAALRFCGLHPAVLAEAAARNPCAPGHPAAVLVARHADPRPESALESVGRGVMIRLGLPVPWPQRVIRQGGRWYRVDMLVEQLWTVVEADGKVKYDDGDPTAGERVWLDKRRRDHLHDWGYEVVRFVMADQHTPRQWGRRCVRSFERAHERRGLPLPDWGPLRKWL